MLYLHNVQRLDQSRGSILMADGQIADVDTPPPAEARVIDADGLNVAPGLLDLQLNGAFGHDFTTNPETIWTVAAELPRYGVTAFLPTIITSPLAQSQKAQQVLQQGPPANWQGAIPIGLHLEGPFLNPAKKGAHNADHLRLPDVADVVEWTPERAVQLVTLAPELPGALTLIETLIAQGVIVSAAHSMATYDDTQKALAAGLSYGTHLFNAMAPLHHRDPALPGALLAEKDLTVGLIPDGIHVHPALVDLVWRIKGSDHLNVVSDGMAALGMTPGEYQLGDQTVIVTDHECRLSDGTLAGSILPLDQAIRNLVAFTGCTIADAIATVTSTPAALLGDDSRGRLVRGARADLVLFTPSFDVVTTIVGGDIVYDQRM